MCIRDSYKAAARADKEADRAEPALSKEKAKTPEPSRQTVHTLSLIHISYSCCAVVETVVSTTSLVSSDITEIYYAYLNFLQD